MDQVIEAARRAMAEGDWNALDLLFHPYLHWRDGTGRITRGRKSVIAMLRMTEFPSLPSSYELREGQIYRWTT